MYKVIVDFTDLKDGNYRYKKDDIYPRKGANPDKKRIDFLAGDNNLMKRPVIKEVSEPKPKKTTKRKSTKTE